MFLKSILPKHRPFSKAFMVSTERINYTWVYVDNSPSSFNIVDVAMRIVDEDDETERIVIARLNIYVGSDIAKHLLDGGAIGRDISGKIWIVK